MAVGIVGVVVEVDTAVVGVDTEGTASGMGKQRLVVGVGVGTTGTASGKQCLGVGDGVGTVATAIAIGREGFPGFRWLSYLRFYG